MAISNHGTKEIHIKILVTGIQGAGKTALMKSLLRTTGSRRESDQLFDQSVGADLEQKAFFEFLPISLGHTENGYHLKGHFYTFPVLQVFESTVFLLMRNVDVLIHVIDGRLERFADEMMALRQFNRLLAQSGLKEADLIRFFVWNKRDLPGILETPSLDMAFNRTKSVGVESVVTKDLGTEELLQHMKNSVIRSLERHPGSMNIIDPSELPQSHLR